MQWPDCIRFKRDADSFHVDFKTEGIAICNNPGIVDENAKSSIGSFQKFAQGNDALLRRHIERLKLHSQILRGQFFYRSFARLTLPRRQNNLSPAISELATNFKTNATISTGHNNDGRTRHIVFSLIIANELLNSAWPRGDLWHHSALSSAGTDGTRRASDWEIPNCRAIRDCVTPAFVVLRSRTMISFPCRSGFSVFSPIKARSTGMSALPSKTDIRSNTAAQ